MKKLSALFILLLITVACQPNPSQRIRYTTDQTDSFNTGNNNSNNNYSGGSTLPGRDGSGTGTGTGTGTDDSNWLDNLPSEVRGCQWSENGQSNFAKYHASIGAYTICQASDEEEVYIQLQNPPNEPLCIIPTNSSNGYTTYIGEPKCFPVYSSQQIYKINLDKNRTGATHLQLNGVAIMIDESHYYPFPYLQNVNHPDAYLYCLQALEMYADARYCYAFDSVGEYVQNDF